MADKKFEFIDEHTPSSFTKLKIALRRYASEVEVDAILEDGTIISLVGIREDGTVVRYSGQSPNLKKAGFQTDGGYIKMFN